jgi:hypothetical protein
MRDELRAIRSTTRVINFRVKEREFQKFQQFAMSVGATVPQLLREMIDDMTEGAEICERALLHCDIGSV